MTTDKTESLESGGAMALQERRLPQTRAALLEVSRVFDRPKLERALNTLADQGWNSVVLHGFFEGYPVFPSPVWAEYGLARQHPRFRKWDPFDVAFGIASRRGLDLLVALTPYLAGPGRQWGRPPILKRYPQWAAVPHPKRRQRKRSPVSPYTYYCPVNADYRRFVCDTLYVLAEDYPFHGLLIDLRHYPFYSRTAEPERVPWCYCKACRATTLRDMGFDPAGMDFSREQPLVERWREWQTRQMDGALAYLRLRALKARRTMRILGLLTCDAGLDAVGVTPLIHWKTWIERALVEALVLDGYSPNIEEFESQLGADLATLPGNSLLIPMLPRKAEGGREFLDAMSKQSIPGFITRFDDWDRHDWSPSDRLEFDTPAFAVESDPIESICALFDGLREDLPPEDEFSLFLADLAHILVRGDALLTVERLLMVAENLKGLHAKVAEGELAFGQEQDRILHDLDLAYRLACLAGCDLNN
ncbi:hypothetical protein JW916_14785 [Candidatus Sumerlaeota bacterium]|nr:hypothetical protein [Candidatus Sumerlaeota bacterium]